MARSKVEKVEKAEKLAVRVGRVAIVGRPNVGKSTLLNALLGEAISITSHHPQTTRDRVLGVLTEKDAQYVFLDTPGVHRARTKLGARMNQEARDAARDADVILFMTEPQRAVNLPGFRASDLALLKELPTGIPIILALNKIDRIHDKTTLFSVLEAHAKAYEFACIIPISAKRRDGLDFVKKEIKDRLPKHPAGEPLPFEDDALTDRPVRYLVAEFVREQILRRTREEVPHGIAVVVDHFDDTQKVPRIEVSIHVDKEAHKKIVIGKAGSLLKEIGTLARTKVERLLGVHVHLQLWVRVTPGWYESDSQLKDLGYGSTARASDKMSSTGKAGPKKKT
jgi:GTP-binding protein Era